MNTGYCIYFNGKLLRIVPEHAKTEAAMQSGNCFIAYTGIASIREAISKIKEEKITTVWLLSFNIDECYDEFKSLFHFIIAGGGLVKNEKEEYLFIFRRGKWDLPKGKLDEMESIEECAVREVKEETGLQNILLLNHLCDSHHVYEQKGDLVLKESVWFNMSTSSHQRLVPQTEEDIEEIVWLAPAQWEKVMQNMYPAIKDVLRQSGELA